MTHPLLRNPSQVGEFWTDELSEFFGKGDLIDTAQKPRFGKGNKSRQKHKTENTLPRFHEKETMKYSGAKKPALLLEFTRPYPDESIFHCETGEVLFAVEKVPNSKKWRSYAETDSWESPVFIANDPASALKILCSWPHWFTHAESMTHWGLIGGHHHVGLYDAVHFVLPFGKAKRKPKFYVKHLSTKHTSGFWAFAPAKLIRGQKHVQKTTTQAAGNSVRLLREPVSKNGVARRHAQRLSRYLRD